ncbi:very short patch repair endonuclease [Glycomyces terrestris]|uniref:Very short patch repair endonuclease n=1 Tax=Glycomyces terrestris TaxID=2493553 RepID=A0A426UY99_9ACTN|nr:very short patch repair endonuclease [Glycomyces terrestris]RRR99543.1 very short patch repair endonuclease [Glycomyces terrestris]
MERQVESWASSEAARAKMRANRARDTKPELRLRRAVHALGLRYRVSAHPIPSFRRTADLVFSRVRLAVFLDGCFWHGCPEHGSRPKTNPAFWHAKIERNMERDAQTTARLREEGWTVLRIWEHQDLTAAAQEVAMTYRTLLSQLIICEATPTQTSSDLATCQVSNLGVGDGPSAAPICRST